MSGSPAASASRAICRSPSLTQGESKTAPCLAAAKSSSRRSSNSGVDCRKRVQYQTYDVTELIKSGKNIITVQLADGWDRGSCGAWGLVNRYGTETKFIAQLELTYTDGTVKTILTDESWDWSNDGPIRFADNKDGEIYNANFTPLYKGKVKVTSHNVVPSASNNVSVTEHETFSAKKITTPAGKTVLDFGQNMAGYVEVNLKAPKGSRIVFDHAEVLDKYGINLKEYCEICEELRDKLFVSGCGWCS